MLHPKNGRRLLLQNALSLRGCVSLAFGKKDCLKTTCTFIVIYSKESLRWSVSCFTHVHAENNSLIKDDTSKLGFLQSICDPTEL